MINIVYKFTLRSGKFYIGLTNDLGRRIKQHFSEISERRRHILLEIDSFEEFSKCFSVLRVLSNSTEGRVAEKNEIFKEKENPLLINVSIPKKTYKEDRSKNTQDMIFSYSKFVKNIKGFCDDDYSEKISFYQFCKITKIKHQDFLSNINNGEIVHDKDNMIERSYLLKFKPKEKEMRSKEYTTQETADELGVSVRQVFRLIEAGKLKSIKRGKVRVIKETEIDRLMEEGW